MSNNHYICVPTVPLSTILTQYSWMFAKDLIDEQIPKGWVELVDLACKDASHDASLKIEKIKLAKGKLCASFLAGSAKTQNAFQAMLAETEAYCPFCGALVEGDAKTYPASVRGCADIPP